MTQRKKDGVADILVVPLERDRGVGSGFARIALGLVVAYLVASRLISDIYTIPVGASIRPSDVILAALLAVWLLWMMASPQPFPMGAASMLGAALIVAVLVAPFFFGFGVSELQADGAERGVVRATLYAGLFIASYHLASSRPRAARILIVAVAATIFQALVAVYEALVGVRLLVLDSIWQSVGLEVDPRGIRSVELALHQRLTGELKVAATAPHPLVLVGSLAVGISICFAFYLYAQSRRVRVVLLGAIGLQLVALGATNQRTAFVVIGAVAIVGGFTQIHKIPVAFPLMATAAFAGFAVFLVSPNTPRLILNFITARPIDHNVAVRTSKYELLPELIEQRPILGAGFLTSDTSLVIFDNGYLTELVELGILGLAILLGFLLVVTGRSFAFLHRAVPADQPILLSAALAGVALLTSMTTFDAMSHAQFFPLCLVIMALGLARVDDLRRNGYRDT